MTKVSPSIFPSLDLNALLQKVFLGEIPKSILYSEEHLNDQLQDFFQGTMLHSFGFCLLQVISNQGNIARYIRNTDSSSWEVSLLGIELTEISGNLQFFLVSPYQKANGPQNSCFYYFLSVLKN